MRLWCLTLTAPHVFVIVSPDWILPGTYSWQPQTFLACQAFFSSSSFTWFHPISAVFCLGVARSHPFSARVDYSRPSVLLHPSGRSPTSQPDEHISFSELQNICGVLDVNQCGYQSMLLSSQGQVCLTSVIKWEVELVKHSSHLTPHAIQSPQPQIQSTHPTIYIQLTLIQSPHSTHGLLRITKIESFARD